MQMISKIEEAETLLFKWKYFVMNFSPGLQIPNSQPARING